MCLSLLAVTCRGGRQDKARQALWGAVICAEVIVCGMRVLWDIFTGETLGVDSSVRLSFRSMSALVLLIFHVPRCLEMFLE